MLSGIVVIDDRRNLGHHIVDILIHRAFGRTHIADAVDMLHNRVIMGFHPLIETAQGVELIL